MTRAGQGNWAESAYFAQPYSLDAQGFYFRTLDEYQEKSSANRDRFGNPVEEYELQYIDGEVHRLFSLLRVSQASLGDWFDLLDELEDDDDRYLIACSLAEDGYGMEQFASRWDDYSVYRGSAADYAREVVADCFEIHSNLEPYLDYERLGRDMVLEGTITEIERDVLLVGG